MSIVTPETIESDSGAYEWDMKVVRLTSHFQSGGATIIVHAGQGVDSKTFQVRELLLGENRIRTRP